MPTSVHPDKLLHPECKLSLFFWKILWYYIEIEGLLLLKCSQRCYSYNAIPNNNSHVANFWCYIVMSLLY